MNIHVDEKKRVWLSYEYLAECGISENSIKCWSKRNTATCKYIDGSAFINYDTIPKPTRKRLYGKETLIYDAKQEDRDTRTNLFYSHLHQAYTGIAVAKWRNLIREAHPKLNNDFVTTFSRRAAVIEKVIDLYPWLCGNLECLFKAYTRIYKGAYSTKRRFGTMIMTARDKGVLAVAVDKRIIREHKPVHGDLHRYWAAAILNHNKTFTIRMSYETFTDLCEQENYKTPSYNWFQSFYKNNKNIIDQNRYGKAEYERLNQNYAKIIPALYAGDQWQMDGWDIPIYCKKYLDNGKIEYYVKYNLFAVLDAHSRKIVGYSIAESENTQSILKGIEIAVKETLTLPYEIVADNHSFNKTKEAGNIKEEMEKLGVTWTIDSNPRRKAIMERAFKTLGEKFFKKEYGYIGQGIKSKEKGGITQQELRDIYTRPDNFLTFDQVVEITNHVIYLYNSCRIKKLQDSPNNLYERSEQPNAIKVDIFQRLKLFTLKGEYKISHGQININRGAHKYEYQLQAEYAGQYNNQIVTVRYADYDTIYLYDLKTDSPICSVNQKFAIHGAKANQTEKDKELLFKNKGRMKGINTGIRNKKRLWCDKAALINPNAYETMNLLTTPKDTIADLRVNADRRAKMIEQGVNPETVQELPKVSEMLDPDMKPAVEKDDRHPFHKGVVSTMQIFNPNN